MSYTLAVGSDGTATTAQVVWSVNGQTYNFRSDNNFIAWITTMFDLADYVAVSGVTQILAGTGISVSPAGGTGVVTITNTGGGGGGLDLIYSDEIPPVAGGAGNLWAKYDVAGAVAGNIRGLGAVDFQQNRTAQTQVASGNFSTIGGGQRNTASGTYSAVAGGSDHTASGYGSFVGGGANNDATDLYATIGGGIQNTASNDLTTIGGGTYNIASNNFATVGGGSSNTASGDSATIGGGRANTGSGSYATIAGGKSNNAGGKGASVGGGISNSASGYYSHVGCGLSNTASGYYTTVGGGISNTASGSYSSVPGGYFCTASGNYSMAGGNGCNASGYNSSAFGGSNNTASEYFSSVFGGLGAKADRYAMSAYAGGFFAATGDAQAVSFVLRGTTAGAVTTNLALDGAYANLTIPTNKVLSGLINIAGVDSAGVESLQHTTQFFIQNHVGTTTMIHQAVVGANHKTNPAITAVISADNANSCLQVACTGLAGTNMRWVAVVNGLEIGI